MRKDVFFIFLFMLCCGFNNGEDFNFKCKYIVEFDICVCGSYKKL